jgi:hypothetical protein
VRIIPNNAAHIGLFLRGTGSQTADLQQWQRSDGLIFGGYDASGRLYFGGSGVSDNSSLRVGGGEIYSGAANAITVNGAGALVIQAGRDVVGGSPVVVKGRASQTADAFQVQNSLGTNLIRVEATGHLQTTAGANIISGGAFAATNGQFYTPSYGTQLNFNNQRLLLAKNDANAANASLAVAQIKGLAVGTAVQTGDLLQLYKQQGDATPVASIAADGTLKTDYIKVQQLSQPAGNIALNIYHGFGVKVNYSDIETIEAGAGLIAKSPDGTRYKLTPPDGGGAATWVAA